MNYRVLKAQRRISKDLSDAISRVNPLYIAAINAAIFTILLAVVTTYTLLINERYHDLELEVYEQADQINKIRFLRTMYFPQKEIYSLPEKSTGFRIDLVLLLSEFPHNSSVKLPSGNDVPKNISDRAELALGLINIIGHSYPFPKGIEIREDGWSSGRVEDIVFKNLSHIREWSRDLKDLNQHLSGIHHMVLFYSKKVMIYFEALKDKNRIRTEKKEILPELIIGEKDPFIIFKNFYENFVTNLITN
jgi:hypothetical protein